MTIDAPIGRDERNRMRRAVYGSGQKEAVTHIRVAERFGDYTLIKARLEETDWPFCTILARGRLIEGNTVREITR